MDYQVQYTAYQAAIEEYLNGLFAQDKPYAKLYEAIRYSSLAGGKRIRPVLTLEFARLGGIDWHLALPYACALELVHNYSLIHDDLPCMDDDDLRRGKPTNHKVFGETMAILAGDALQPEAFRLIAQAPGMSAESRIDAVEVLAKACGADGMVGGQVLDILSESRDLTEKEVIDIQSRKTGRLINAACVLGVIAAGGSGEQIEAAAKFAGLLGLAFQIRDDMLDVIGTQEEMGKGVGTDETKNTFVKLYGLSKCEGLVQEYTAKAIGELKAFKDTEYMTELAKSLTARRV